MRVAKGKMVPLAARERLQVCKPAAVAQTADRQHRALPAVPKDVPRNSLKPIGDLPFYLTW